MKKLIIATIFFFCLLKVGEGTQCIPPQNCNRSPVEEYFASRYVFIGKVVSVKDLQLPWEKGKRAQRQEVTFNVQEIFKGNPDSKINVQSTPDVCGGSGKIFEVDKEYLIYVSHNLLIRYCSRTTALALAGDDLEDIKKILDKDEKKKFGMFITIDGMRCVEWKIDDGELVIVNESCEDVKHLPDTYKWH